MMPGPGHDPERCPCGQCHFYRVEQAEAAAAKLPPPPPAPYAPPPLATHDVTGARLHHLPGDATPLPVPAPPATPGLRMTFPWGRENPVPDPDKAP